MHLPRFMILGAASIALLGAVSILWLRDREPDRASPALLVGLPVGEEVAPATAEVESRPSQDPMRVAVPTPSPQAVILRASVYEYDDEFALLAAHLSLAPRDLQSAARQLFETQAEHYRRRVQDADFPPGLDGVMEELECRFAARLRMLAADRLGAEQGLLLVDGLDYDKAIAGKRHLISGGGEQVHRRQVGVIVVLNEVDRELEELDATYCDARQAWIFEKAHAWNSQPFDLRKAEIDEFVAPAPTAAGSPARRWFGLDSHLLRLVRVNRLTMTIEPVD
jgi:hypothetical protein